MAKHSTKTIKKHLPHRRTSWAALALTPILALTFMSVASASATGITQLTSEPPTHAPRNGEDIPNITLVEDDIALYYGSVTQSVSTDPCLIGIAGSCVTEETLPSPHSNYAQQMRAIEKRAEHVLGSRDNGRGHGWRTDNGWGHHPGWGHRGNNEKPALVFDIDDTLLNTYNYEVAMQYSYTPASNASWVEAEAFPAVFGMTDFLKWAVDAGYSLFFITGRPVSQLDATIGNLKKVGYDETLDGSGDGQNVFLKNSGNPPSYLTCATTGDGTCSTIEYKSETRRHIEALGYDIEGSFGDQYSDLKGGYADHTFKLPNPMYYLP